MNIRFETLQQAEQDLSAAYAAVQSTVENLESELQSNLGQWTGTAQEAYAQVKLQWDQALAHMAAVLQKAGGHIASAAETYQAVENQNLSIWHR
jgi:WXG100 family type VII secretion target